MKRRLVIFKPAKRRTGTVVFDGEQTCWLEKVVVDEASEA